MKTRSNFSHDYNGNIVWSKEQSWETGDHVTPCTYGMNTYSGSGGSAALGSQPLAAPQGVDNNALNQATANVMSTFQEALSSQATWANNALEAEGSANMIGATCSKLLGFGKALDRGAPASYLADLLGISHQKSKWGNAKSAGKSFGDAWLSWHFGWSPMADDIGAAMDHVNDPAGFTRRIRGRASSSSEWEIVSRGPSVYYVDRTKFKYHVLAQADVTLQSPILASLSGLGFVNPLTVAWEAVPYSFVVDWFTNVGQFLGQSTMMLGFSISNQMRTEYIVGDRENISIDVTEHPDPLFDYRGASHSATVNRVRALPPVPLVFKPFKGFSTSRGATAAALLAQFLPHH